MWITLGSFTVKERRISWCKILGRQEWSSEESKREERFGVQKRGARMIGRVRFLIRLETWNTELSGGIRGVGHLIFC